MIKSKYNGAQITKAIKEIEYGRTIDDICKEFGVEKPTFYSWISYAVCHVTSEDCTTTRYSLCGAGRKIRADEISLQ
ncbi:MAG TPA: transposase [Pseudosphingobacterium sp.]|nr:transposase [Pseudosphingobacterium sp.]